MAKLFQISQGDVGFTYNNVNYSISDYDTVNYTFAKKNHLTRGANGSNKVGTEYTEGLKTPDVAEAKITDCSTAIYKLLLEIFNTRGARINFWFVDRATGEGYTFKNAKIRDKPRQTSIDESEDSIGFMLAVESFNVTEKLDDE
jgi:hypothetical protein